jgi:hypothetical protein
MAENRPLLNGIGIDVDAVEAKRDRGGQGAERLLFHLHLGGRAGLDRGIDRVGRHAPQLAGGGQRCTVDVQVNTMLCVRRVEHCDGEGLAIPCMSQTMEQGVLNAVSSRTAAVLEGWMAPVNSMGVAGWNLRDITASRRSRRGERL